MKKFEYFFMNKEDYDKYGVDESKFKNKENISNIQIITTKKFCYIEENFKDFPSISSPYELKEIDIIDGCVMIIGYLNPNENDY